MADYRILWADLKTGAVQGEVPAESFTYSHIRNAPGACSIVLPLRPNRPDQVATLTESSFAPARTSLFVLRDSVPVWGGILWTIQADVETNSLTASGEGFLSYFRKRFLRGTYHYYSVEQVLIAQSLLTHALEAPGGEIPVSVDTATGTDVIRTRVYYGYERKNVGEAVEQLAAVRNGFDFTFAARWDGDALGVDFLTSYPNTGRTTEHVLELGSNVELLSLSDDGTGMANQVDAVGGGSGYDLPIRTATDTSLLSAYPLLQAVGAHSDVIEEDTLQEYADARLIQGRRSIKIPKVRLSQGSIPSIGAYLVGDQVRVRGAYGYLSIDDFFRITAIEVAVGQNGDESANLTLAPVGAFDE
jgi:hypothetical protein